MTVISVGGMHRSGTSMVARVLNVMGVHLGEQADLVPPGPENPDGYWEHAALVDINDEILHEFGGGWDLPVALPNGWPRSERVDSLRVRARHVLGELNEHDTWGWKDPRNSLTLPFWQELVPDLKVLVCVRSPLEVALSLNRWRMFSYSLGVELWQAYNERILASTTPTNRLVTLYDQYFDDGRVEVARLARFVGVDASGQTLDAALPVIRGERRHWRVELDELRDAGLPAAVTSLYMELCQEAGETDPRRCQPRSRAVRKKRPGVELVPVADAPPTRQVERAVVENAMLRTRLQSLKPQLDARNAEFEQLEAELDNAHTALVELRNERDMLLRLVAAGDGRQEQLLQLVSELRDQIDRRGNEAQKVLYDLRGFQTGLRTPPTTDDADTRYRQTVDRIREAVHAHVPQEATVVVASKGDDELIELYGRRAWHFPRLLDGTYLGHHPASSEAALVHLRAAQALGATHFVLPADMSWWLDHYTDLTKHFDRRCRLLYQNNDCCRIYSLLERPRGAGTMEADALDELIAEFHARFDRDPTILDWRTNRDLARELPQLQVFSPPADADQLDYLDHTVDVVAVTDGPDAVLREAVRVAAAAVVVFGDDANRTGARVYGSRAPEIQWRHSDRHTLPSTSIVIPCYDGVEHTRTCLETLATTLSPRMDVEVIVVDDASSDGTNRYLRDAVDRFSWLNVLRNSSNEGYLRSVNRGARVADGEVLVFLNNDTILLSGWLVALLRTFGSHPDAGVVGGKLLYPDGRIQEAGGIVFSDGSAAKFGAFDAQLGSPLYNFVREVDYCSGALLATPHNVFDELGGFDPEYGPGYYEDTDYCFRVRASGRRVIYQPASAIVHVEGATAGRDVSAGMKQHQVLNHRRFVERWDGVLTARPNRPPEPFDAATLFELAATAARRGEG